MPKANASKPARHARRREELRRNLPKPAFDYRNLFRRPDYLIAALIFLVFGAVVGSLIDWSREQILVRDGQIMTDTRVRRLDYRFEDLRATQSLRTEARENAPSLYRTNETYLQTLKDAIVGLPQAGAGKNDIARIVDDLVLDFGLDEAGLTALQEFVVDGKATLAWESAVDRLINVELKRYPLMSTEDYQGYSTTKKRARLVSDAPEPREIPFYQDPIELGADEATAEKLQVMVVRAGFPEKVAPYMVTRLMARPTFEYLRAETEARADAAAAAIDAVIITRGKGKILYHRGQRLTIPQYDEVNEEMDQYHGRSDTAGAWIPRVGIYGTCLLLLGGLGFFLAIAYPRLIHNSLRTGSVCLIMAAMLAVAASITKQAPTFLYLAGIAPTLFVVVVMLLVYDQRLAAVVGAVQCVLTTIALQQSTGWLLLLLVGCGAMIGQLPEVRHRNSLIRSATGTALTLAAAAMLFGLYETPLVEGAWQQILRNAGLSGAASFGVGFLVLGLLPSIERAFGITTGMTLADLRDPKQPLLRQLQQRAAGTYNHSLQVANISEAAAEAIGADSLLVYVGAMYHDIGKVNKPEYFVENQAGGDNKHAKLSPAMSLLVIIGHVKDGIELAREYGLPKAIIHIIESHHGTTLVEYFYHAAKERAEANEKATVAEVEFRYPGPKPQTREAAIVMLADAVESATRAMAEPNPARIESLVRSMSRKRMMDGQFDRCPLTFRELGLIEEAAIVRLCAIHHGRISYPSKDSEGSQKTA